MCGWDKPIKARLFFVAFSKGMAIRTAKVFILRAIAAGAVHSCPRLLAFL